MSRRGRCLLLAMLVFAGPAGTASAQEQDPGIRETGQYRYYIAAVAAANAFLQLHDIVAVRHWLNEAPSTHRGWEWSYLSAMSDRSDGAFFVHESALTDMSVSPDGRLIAIASGNEIALHDSKTGQRLRTLSGHTRSAWNARFSASGAQIATVASDGTLRIWDPETGQEQLQIEDIGHGVAAVAWRPDGLEIATVSWKRSEERGVYGVIDIWDPVSGKRIQHIDHGVKPIASANYAPDGSRLYVGTWDFDVSAYETDSWRQTQMLLPPDDGIYKAVRESRPSPNGVVMAAAYEDGAVRIWDTASAELRQVLHRQSEGAQLAQNDLVWFPDNRRLVSASKDLTIRIWDAIDAEHLLALHGHSSTVTALALSPDARTLFSGDASGEIRRWDLRALAPERSRWKLPDAGYSLAFSPDGRQVASTGWNGWVAIFDPESGTELTRWEGHGISGVRVAWSPNGYYLASTGNDGMVKVWDTRATPPVLVFEHAVEMQSLAVAFSSNGDFLASPAASPSLKVWSMPEGSEAGILDDSVTFSGAAWHPQLPLLAASSGDDGIVRIWDPATGETSARLEGHGMGMLQSAFSDDGKRLAAASGSGKIRIWDLHSFELLQEMHVSNGGQITVAFSPDGFRLATAGNDKNVHIWDPASGIHLLNVPFSASLWEIAWSPDGRKLLTIPLDGTIQVLEAGRTAAN